MRTAIIFLLLVGAVHSANINGVQIPDNELRAIWSAVRRNVPDKRYHQAFAKLLIAIRKAENGRPGREFGVRNPKATDLDSQAGHCAYLCWTHYRMWKMQGQDVTPDFVLYLWDFYAPVGAHAGNENWYGNVTAVLKKLKS